MPMRALHLGAVALVCGLVGCSEAFDPRVRDDRAFAVYGTLDGRRPIQRLRVQDVSIPVGQTPGALPASVTSTELTSGVTTVWADSLVVLDDGGRGHVFTAPLALRPGEIHRLRVERDADGATSTAEVHLPTPAVTIGPASPELRIRVNLGGLPVPPPAVRVRYRGRLGTEQAEVVSTYGVTAATDASILLALENDARRLRLALGGKGSETELLSVVIEGQFGSPEPVPIRDGIGGLEWVVPFSLPLDLLSADIEASGLVDARDG